MCLSAETAEVVKESLSNAIKNGFFGYETNSMLIAEGMVNFDQELEHLAPEDIVPTIELWLRNKKLSI